MQSVLFLRGATRARRRKDIPEIAPVYNDLKPIWPMAMEGDWFASKIERFCKKPSEVISFLYRQVWKEEADAEVNQRSGVDM
jgi:hypothetical protein